MPEDFEEVARHAGRAIRNEATEADARLEEPVQSSNRAKKRVAVVLIAAAAAVAGGFVVINGGSSHKSTPRIATNGSTTTTVAPTTTRGGFVAVPGQVRAFAPVSATFVSTNAGWTLGRACQGSSCPAVLMHTTNGGRSWSQVPAPDAQLSVEGVAAVVRFANAHDGWIFGPQLWSTHDGGANWRRVALQVPGGTPTQMALEVAGPNVVAVTISDRVTLWSSPIDHDDWRASNVTVNIGAGPIPQAQLAANGSEAWMLLVNRTLAGAARFVNGQWETWTAPTSGNLGGHNRLAVASRTDVFIVGDNAFGQWPGPESTKIFTSANGGATFDAGVVIPDVFSADAFAAASPTTLAVSGSGAQNGAFVEMSRDAGASWTDASALPGTAIVAQLGFTTGAQGFLITTGSSPVMQMTYDSGSTWHTVRFPQALVVTR